MTELIGSAAYLVWNSSAGTSVLSADYRSFSWKETAEQYDATAGSDTTKVWIPGMKDYTCSYTGVGQVQGTALENSLRAGQIGTLVFYPEGTAVGHRIYTLPTIVTQSPYNNWQYNAVVETAIEWMAYGAATLGTT
jgi:hypothetical protein